VGQLLQFQSFCSVSHLTTVRQARSSPRPTIPFSVLSHYLYSAQPNSTQPTSTFRSFHLVLFYIQCTYTSYWVQSCACSALLHLFCSPESCSSDRQCHSRSLELRFQWKFRSELGTCQPDLYHSSSRTASCHLCRPHDSWTVKYKSELRRHSQGTEPLSEGHGFKMYRGRLIKTA